MKTTLHFLIYFQFLFYNAIDSCGVTTHIEISHRAKTYFKDDFGAKIDYAELIRSHNDALMAGSPFPDAFYDVICADGKYHSVSEDTHWAPFVNASVSYINAKYPQPWDEATEKLVVFLFGVVSHQVADILWHSLGIDQGFLRAMADINFHGDFDKAHSAGDIGGDILTEYELDTSYIPMLEGWYIPTEDLYNIYNLYNGTQMNIPKDIILACSGQLFLERLAELIGAKELYPHYAAKSPFMVDQFERYFLGGVDDMAGWTHRIWQQTVIMIENGPRDCDIPQSTLFLNCNKTLSRQIKYQDPRKSRYFRHPLSSHVTYDDLIFEKDLRGIRIKPSPSFLTKLKKKREKTETLKFESSRQKLGGEPRYPDKLLFVKTDYARLGEDYATGDLNFDGKPDLVVTAPGYGTVGSPQEGRVYIIYGDDKGIPMSLNPDLDNLEVEGQGQILKGLTGMQSRFGTSVAVLDINLDGVDDIAIGAPSMIGTHPSTLQYNGQVRIYLGDRVKRKVASRQPNITITCNKVQYCNLGFALTFGDVNNDGHPDLVIGAPFAHLNGEQTGFVTAVFAGTYNMASQVIDIDELTWGIVGDQSYGWFGHSLSFSQWNKQNVLFVSQPEYRICSGSKTTSNCPYDRNNATLSVGKMHAYYGLYLVKHWAALGKLQFAQTGWSIDIGKPFPDQSKQVMAVSQPGEGVHGSVGGFGIQFDQAGSVGLFNMTSEWPTTDDKLSFKTVLQGDRSFERFGAKVKFWDVNNDSLSDLIIGAPFRTEDITEEIFDPEQGQVYIYKGGENFPSKIGCGNSLIHPCPRLQADIVLKYPGDQQKTRFGTNFAFLKSALKRQIIVTAEHASNYARHGGAVGIFNF